MWIFSNKEAFNEYHVKVKGESIDQGVAGYFSPMTGWVYLYDEEGSDREFEVNKNVHEGTHQLQHWFTRQKNEWGPARVPQSFFGEGFAEYTGSVIMAPDRALKFIGINRPRLQSLKQIKHQRGQGNQKMWIFPLKTLVEFEGYHNVRAWGAQNWDIDAIFVFYIQSWALVYFLNDHENHKYQSKFNGFVDDMLNHPKDVAGVRLRDVPEALRDLDGRGLEEARRGVQQVLRRPDEDGRRQARPEAAGPRRLAGLRAARRGVGPRPAEVATPRPPVRPAPPARAHPSRGARGRGRPP